MDTKVRQQYVLTGVLALLVLTVGWLAYSNHQLNQRLDAALGQNASGVAHAAVRTTPAIQKEIIQPPSAEDEDWEIVEPPAGAEWNPFQEMERMQREMDQLFGSAFGRMGKSPHFGSLFDTMPVSPRMNFVDKGDSFVMTYAIPGADEAGIEVSVDGRTLSVSAETESGSGSGQGQALRQERRTGSFQRIITLPAPVDADSLQTTYEDGVLTVTLKKA